MSAFANKTTGRPELKVRAPRGGSVAAAGDRTGAPPHPLASFPPPTHPRLPPPQVAETWDACIENTVRKLAYGALAGGLAAMILFRTPPPSRPRLPSPHAPGPLPGAARPRADARVLLLLRAGSPSARSSVVGLGAGVGVGMGYTDCKHEFDEIAKAEKD
jgi:hypothetical protein